MSKVKCSGCGKLKGLSAFSEAFPNCKICRRKELARARYAADPEVHREASKKFRENNPEYHRQYLAGYYLTHKEQWKVYSKNRDPQKVRKARAAYMTLKGDQVRAGVRDWFRRNPKVAAINAAKYRMRRSKVENTLTPAQIEETLEVFDHRCGYCLVDLRTLPASKRTLDHLLPIVRGGANTQENIVPCCKSCNSRKGSRHIALMTRYL